MSNKDGNSFDEVRFLLAFIVMVSHTSALASIEKLDWFTDFFDSDFAVKGFFAISGYLVTKSYLSSHTFMDYFKKRIRRIYPAYLLALCYCILVGLATTELEVVSVIFNVQFFEYLCANFVFLNFLEPNLPGSLPNSAVQALNGSLWTIKIELLLYVTVPFLIIFYRKSGPYVVLAMCFGIGAFWYTFFTEYFDRATGIVFARQLPGQLPFFAFGSMLQFIPLGRRVSLFILMVGLFYFTFAISQIGVPYREIVNMVIYPSFTIMLARSVILSVNLGKLGDFSYGIYLFHFPTIQLLEHFGLYKFNPYLGFFTGIVCTVILAVCSWHLVEKRFLRRAR